MTHSPDITILKTDRNVYASGLDAFEHSLFITPDWMEAVSEPKKPVLYLNVCHNGNVVGKIAGLVVRGPMLNKELYFYSEPALLNYSAEALNRCLEKLAIYAKENGFARITFNYLDQKSMLIPENCGLKIKPTAEYIIHLQNDYKAFAPGNNFKNKLKKAQKAGTRFCVGQNPEMVDDLLNLLEATLKNRVGKNRHRYDILGYKHLTGQTLKKLVASGSAVFYYTENEAQVHFISLCLEIDHRAYELYNGTDDFGYRNGLTGWMVKMRADRYQKMGNAYFNMGGVPHEQSDKNNLSEFKMQSGCTPANVYIAQSEFLNFPEKLANPFFNLGRLMPYNRFTRYLIKLMG